MKVLFLDIDGVVNNKRTNDNFEGFIAIDPAMAALVQRIVQNTGCEIVLTSSWRLFQNSRYEIERKICKFADITPILHTPRGYEIAHAAFRDRALCDSGRCRKHPSRATGEFLSNDMGKWFD